jgi:hypothetical protein
MAYSSLLVRREYCIEWENIKWFSGYAFYADILFVGITRYGSFLLSLVFVDIGL